MSTLQTSRLQPSNIQASKSSAHCTECAPLKVCAAFLKAAVPVRQLLTDPGLVVASMGWNSDEQRKMKAALELTRDDIPGWVWVPVRM